MKSQAAEDLPDPVKQKLTEVLSEGILDSVLPYMVPSTSVVPNNISRKSSHHQKLDKMSQPSLSSNASDVHFNHRKSDGSITAISKTE